MEAYDRKEIVECEVRLPFPEDITGKDFSTVKVKPGSKIFNLLKFALASLEKNTNLVIVASGPGITKAVTVAEIIKRRQPKVYQWNKIGFKKIEEFWHPKVGGMARVQVNREIPIMHIFLTTTPLDSSLPGVQVPDSRAKDGKRNRTNRAKKPFPKSSGAKDVQEQKRSCGSKPGPRRVNNKADKKQENVSMDDSQEQE